MSEQLRALMRFVAHPVVVCTSSLPAATATSTKSTPRGMTMSSFTSLSLDPTPVVALNIATPSRTLDAIVASRNLNIHIVAGNAAGARLADWFTRGNAQGAAAFDGLPSGCECTVRASDDVAHGADPPLLVGRGVLHVLRCRLLDEPSQGLVKVRDHVMVLGEVVHLVQGYEASDQGQEELFGLIYADRKYRKLGSTMVRSARSIEP